MANVAKVKKSPKNSIAARLSESSPPSPPPPGPPSSLPPIGVFWDIENCQVPRGKSAGALVQLIRQRFFTHHREAEFLCVCDIHKERKDVIHELNLSQITVIHINATSKNAADEKLKQCMHRFADTYGAPSSIILISGDVNFAPHLSDFRHRQNIHIILIHGTHTPEALIVCAHEHYNFFELAKTLPPKEVPKPYSPTECELCVTDLPKNRDALHLQGRLKQLSDNCGGRVINLSLAHGTAVLRFPNPQAAQRARKRMDKENVFGSKISVSFHYAHHRDSSSNARTSLRHHPQHTSSESSSRDSSPQTANSLSDHDAPPSPQRKKDFPPPPDLISQASKFGIKTFAAPRHEKKQKGFTEPSFSQTSGNMSIFEGDVKSLGEQASQSGPSSKFFPGITLSNRSPNFKNHIGAKPPKNIGRVSPFSSSNPKFPTTDMNSLLSSSTSASNIYFNSPRSTSLINRIFPQPSVSCSENQDLWETPDLLSAIKSLPTVSEGTSGPVELLVTNLDQTMETNELKKILLSLFREYVMVLNIALHLQPDNHLKALVKVPSLQDAQYAISQLHRCKIGSKRILISYLAEKSPPLHFLKAEVVSLLSDIPARKLPLFKFRELFEQRYHRGVSLSELHRLKDTITINDESSGRLISLHPDYRPTPSPISDLESSQEGQFHLEKPFCEQHYEILEGQGWAEQETVYPLPDVYISLKMLAPQVHNLLDGHQGFLPLNSFCSCYKAEFGPLPIVPKWVDMVVKEGTEPPKEGVPLEHLIACIPGVQITKSSLGIKKIQWIQNQNQQDGVRSVSPALKLPLALFCRETTDLLKSKPGAMINFNQFVPDYHHHFGRQCRVADYGFTKLQDLLEAISHVVQILGQNQRRIITLTHRTQVKRFSSELLRVLKTVPGRQIRLGDLPAAFTRTLGRPFCPADYGVCFVEDLLADLDTSATPQQIAVTTTEDETVISIPKKEQTTTEIARTRQFEKEVVELLSHTAYCSMGFSKFIPAYHHHFNRQCRLADFGCTKLQDLFEIIPHVIQVLGSGEDKTIRLTETERLKILSERIFKVIKNTHQPQLKFDQLLASYAEMFGHVLKPQEFGTDDLSSLLEQLKPSLKVVDGSLICLNSPKGKSSVKLLSLQVRKLLMEEPDSKLSMNNFIEKITKYNGQPTDLSTLKELNIIEIEDGDVKLTPLQCIAKDLILLLEDNGNQMLLSEVEGAFKMKYGTPFPRMGFPSLPALINALGNDLLQLRGRRNKKMVVLVNVGNILPLKKSCTTPEPSKNNNKVCTSASSSKFPDSQKNVSHPSYELSQKELLRYNSPIDLLSQPIPSNVPSPEIKPEKQDYHDSDLMGFESPHLDVITGESKEDPRTGFEPLQPSCSASSQVESFLQTLILNASSMPPHPVAIDAYPTPVSSDPHFTPAFPPPPPPLAYFVPSCAAAFSTVKSLPTVSSSPAVQPSLSSCHDANFGLAKETEPLLDDAQVINAHSLIPPSPALLLRPDSMSCEDLSLSGNLDKSTFPFPSTQSTPTRVSSKQLRSCRIAAHFSIPLQ